MPSKVPPISVHSSSGSPEPKGPSRELIQIVDQVSELTPSISGSMGRYATAATKKRSFSQISSQEDAVMADECASKRLQKGGFFKQLPHLKHII